jgi:hypothetical protein
MGRPGQHDRGSPEELNQLVPDDPHHLLTRGEAPEHFLTYRSRLDPSDKVPSYSYLDICLQQRSAHVAQALSDIVRAETGLPCELSEHSIETTAEGFEHGPFRPTKRAT